MNNSKEQEQKQEQEQLILHKITSLNCLYFNTIEFISLETKNIENEITKLTNNNIFENNPSILHHFYKLMNIKTLNELKNKITEYADILEKNTICDHEWIDDYIDITPDRSMPITYCEKCEATKK